MQVLLHANVRDRAFPRRVRIRVDISGVLGRRNVPHLPVCHTRS